MRGGNPRASADSRKRGRDIAQAGGRVSDDRQQAVEKQGDQCGLGPDPQPGDHEHQEGQRGDRLDDPGRGQDDRPQPRPAGRNDPERDRDEDRGRQRDRDECEVLAQAAAAIRSPRPLRPDPGLDPELLRQELGRDRVLGHSVDLGPGIHAGHRLGT